LAGVDIQVTFHTGGKLAGAIVHIATSAGKVAIPEENSAPEVKLIRQDSKLKRLRESPINYYTHPEDIVVKDLRWDSGPLLAKLVLKIVPRAAPSDMAEYVFMIPKHGSEFMQTELFYPEEPGTSDTVGAKGNAVLTGKLIL